MRVYISFDELNSRTTKASTASLRRLAVQPPDVLYVPKLTSQGLLHRNAAFPPESEESALSRSRFLVPLICQEPWAVFVDHRCVFLRNPAEMLANVNPKHAVSVVKHRRPPPDPLDPKALQSFWSRQNWSSVMVFNCLHPANMRLCLRDVNDRPGRDLNAFYWLADSEIGDLDQEWNWLVGTHPKPDALGIANFIGGGPHLPNWPGSEHDHLWHNASHTPS